MPQQIFLTSHRIFEYACDKFGELDILIRDLRLDKYEDIRRTYFDNLFDNKIDIKQIEYSAREIDNLFEDEIKKLNKAMPKKCSFKSFKKHKSSSLDFSGWLNQ
jgi:hypothetical protein